MTNTYKKDQKEKKKNSIQRLFQLSKIFFQGLPLKKKTLQKAQPGSSQVRPTRI
jgi:hypothetical protein